MWHRITNSIISQDAINQVHNAVQFISLTGKNLLKQQPDDSNTNTEWSNDNNSFAGHWIEGSQVFRLELTVLEFRLEIRGLNFNKIFSLELHGQTREQILNWLKSCISSLGLDSEKLKYIDHYQIPKHYTSKGGTFLIPDIKDLESIVHYYSNADYILKKFNDSSGYDTLVRIWPHHFDIGSYIPINGAEGKALATGMAIPDSIIKEFYYYQYAVSDKKEIDYSQLPDFPELGNWCPQSWHGGALPLSLLLDVQNQEEAALKFFEFGKEQLLAQMD